MFRHMLQTGVLGSALMAGAVHAQDADEADAVSPVTSALSVPVAPADADLPEIETVISDDEFENEIPALNIADDAELDMPLESIDEFEQRVAAEQAESSQDDVEQFAEVPDPELRAPLPPITDFQVEPTEFAEAESDADPVEVRYDVALNGVENADRDSEIGLRGMFNDLSALHNGDGTASNVDQITARLEEDSRLIERILASEGWYEARIEARIERSTDQDAAPLTAVLDVVPGARYTFSEITVVADATQPANLIEDNLALQVGEPIVAARVQGAEAQVMVALPEQGYPFAQLGQRDILLDKETKDGVYTLPVDIGPRSVFNGITTTGNLAFDADHVRVLTRFERGDLYNSREVDDLRQALVATGLFQTVSVQPERTGELADDGAEYVTIAVGQEAGPPRTLAGTAGYGTGQGFRVSGSWTHRNLFPPEGAVIGSAVLGTQEQGLSATFRRSNAGRRDRTFAAVAEALHSDYDAFEAFTGRVAVRVSYDSTPIWQKKLTYAYGAQLIATVEDDFNLSTGLREDRTFFIGGLTGLLGLDYSDSLLNPTKGFRVSALVEPEGSIDGGFSPYVRTLLDGSGYFPVNDSLVVAGRLRVGLIPGVERFDLAPSRRFYAGGGGSVRGFAYQNLGPKSFEPNPKFDATDPEETAAPFISRPIGGRSLNEAALEVRYRFGNFGVVGFVDAGQVYEREYPDFSGLRYGAGIGGRYYTNFGPLRVDIATPLDRKPGEPRINVYVSIGQAF